MKSLIDTTNLTRSEIIMQRLFECYHNGEVDNTQLWQIFERTADMLGLVSPAEYQKKHGISNQAAHRKPFKRIFGSKVIIDNY
jgi:hypothetical protein